MMDLLKSWKTLLPQPGTERKVFLLGFCVALIFALYTQHLWEDYYITYRASKNLATGKGLVFTEGQRVHTFTSPLGVLLPAVCSMLTLNQSDTVAIWLFRLLAGTFLGLANVIFYRLANQAGWGRWPQFLLAGMFAFDAKTVDYSINGMETSFLLFFLVLTLYALIQEGKDAWRMLGLAWAGLMWSRPDAFIYIGATAIFYALFKHGRNWKKLYDEQFLSFLKAGGLTTCLYLPWLLWAWSYYGSPIPNTIIAKGLDRHHIELIAYLRAAVVFPLKIIYENTSLQATFAPAYHGFGSWPEAGKLFWRWVPLIPACYWVFPRGHALARGCSVAFVIGHYYLTRVSPIAYSWYLPPVMLLGLVPLADAVHRLLGWLATASSQRFQQVAIKATVGLLIVAQLCTLLLLALQVRAQQRLVEIGLRKQIGLWLRENAASPADTVFLEPLGYIGYFSQLKMLDWPGLSSPEVIAARRQTGYLSYMDLRLLEVLQPDWVVLRPMEYEGELVRSGSFLARHYQVAKVFDISKEVKECPLRYGRRYLEFDQHFTVFKRIGPRSKEAALPVPSP